MSQNNNFFHRNTISNFKVDNNATNDSFKKVRSKRASSVANLKLNPDRFLHRQVFDSQIYKKVNFFSLNLKDVKAQSKDNKREEKQLKSSIFELFELFEQNQLLKFYQNYIKTVELLVKVNQKEVADGITGLITNLIKKVTQNVNNLIRKNDEQQTIIQKISQSLNKKQSQDSLLTQCNLKRQLQKIQKERRQQKTFKGRLNSIEFQHKKQILKCQQLEQTMSKQSDLIISLQKENSEMSKKIEDSSKGNEIMQYKMKRMKQELEVAHVIKEQNLADKMKYIMDW